MHLLKDGLSRLFIFSNPKINHKKTPLKATFLRIPIYLNSILPL